MDCSHVRQSAAGETAAELGEEQAVAAAVVEAAVAAAFADGAAATPSAAADAPSLDEGSGLDFNAYVLSFFEIADLWTDSVCEVRDLARKARHGTPRV